MPVRHAGAGPSPRGRSHAVPRPHGAPAIVLPLEHARRYHGRLRRLQAAAPAALRDRVTRELRRGASDGPATTSPGGHPRVGAPA